MQPTPTRDAREVAEEADLGPFPNFLRPLVDRVARVKATVHVKLLVGFLTIAMLLLGLGVLSILVLNRVNNQVETLTTLNAQADNARQMIYGVTAQSHFRASVTASSHGCATGGMYTATFGAFSRCTSSMLLRSISAWIRATSAPLNSMKDTFLSRESRTLSLVIGIRKLPPR